MGAVARALGASLKLFEYLGVVFWRKLGALGHTWVPKGGSRPLQGRPGEVQELPKGGSGEALQPSRASKQMNKKQTYYVVDFDRMFGPSGPGKSLKSDGRVITIRIFTFF